jgi:hypothetical protein
MLRILLATSLVVLAAACGSNSAGTSSNTTPTAATPPQGGVCNDEVISPRGTATPRCYTKEQLEEQKRFTTNTKLDPEPRNTYNN